jgi:hypothetical protein
MTKLEMRFEHSLEDLRQAFRIMTTSKTTSQSAVEFCVITPEVTCHISVIKTRY